MWILIAAAVCSLLVAAIPTYELWEEVTDWGWSNLVIRPTVLLGTLIGNAAALFWAAWQ